MSFKRHATPTFFKKKPFYYWFYYWFGSLGGKALGWALVQRKGHNWPETDT